jgi:hypothetical protein
VCKGNQLVNIRDKRTIGEQIRSGFHLAGWILITVVFTFLVLGSTTFVVGKGDFIQPVYRYIGACGLIATSAVMFLSARHWVKWFFGALVYVALKAAIALLLGFGAAVPSLARPRFLFLEVLILAALAAALCFRYLSHAPHKVEAAALVGLVITLSFATVCDSNLPFVAGIVVLGLSQLASTWAYRKHRHVRLEPN